MNFDQSVIDELVEVVYKRVDERIRAGLQNANIEFCKNGIVKSVSETETVVEISGKNYSVANKTGQTLQEGNEVKVYYENENMKNAYVGVVL